MTSIEWLVKEIKKHDKDFSSFYGAEITQAKERHEQEIIDAHNNGYERLSGQANQYYQETFGSKRSDKKPSPTKISDESWEGCDGCTEQDEVMYKNGYVKGYNAGIADLPKEISDKEIEEAADKYVSEDDYNRYLECFKAGAKWMQEQLKHK